MGFNYFYRNQLERFAFVQIPRIIMTGDEFAMLSVEAKVLYGLLLDTMCRSLNNQWVDGIFDIMLETLLCEQEYIIVSSNRYPAEFVKSKILRINMSNIEYVLSSMRENRGRIRNIRKYLLAALFNSPSTMESYYQAEINCVE